MIADERSHIKKLGIRRILKAKNQPPEKLRIFKIPDINWNAEDYTELINWSECSITEPPLTMDIKNEDFLAAIKNLSAINISKLPCHTQVVERCIKLVTEASNKVCEHSARDGFIRSEPDQLLSVEDIGFLPEPSTNHVEHSEQDGKVNAGELT
ncbi:unnamed protein product [Psylliodes chrysocephalus]|uniref:Uncharacterized protein n=1 Tax=Psylliodes chrysocephalus TaxID=3402493 RepID=A0A9P0CZI4_9CUCU|nr:unnamed protein product [Psylliodes chrysocephala]